MSGVSTIVEVIDCNRWVIVLVSEKSREAAEICSTVIRIVLHLQQELCRPVGSVQVFNSLIMNDAF